MCIYMYIHISYTHKHTPKHTYRNALADSFEINGRLLDCMQVPNLCTAYIS